MLVRTVQPRMWYCVKPRNLHGTDPDGGALFISGAAGARGLRHCRQGIKLSKSWCRRNNHSRSLRKNHRTNNTHTHTHTYTFNGPFSGTTQVGRYKKDKTNLDFTEARDSEWQWHQLGLMQVRTSIQTDIMPASHHSVFLKARCPSCQPNNSDKALEAVFLLTIRT